MKPVLPMMALWISLAAVFMVVVSPIPTAGAQDQDSATVEVDAAGVAGITIGSTFDEVNDSLAAPLALTEGQILPEGQRGRAIERDGETIAWLVSTSRSAGGATGGSARIDVIMLIDPIYRTADGIGPGSTIAEARAVYGAALAESAQPGVTGETISFVNGPTAIDFVTSRNGQNQSGRYRDGRTVSFAPDSTGTIEALLLGCADADCSWLLGDPAASGASPPTTPPTTPPTALATTGTETRLMTFAVFLVGGGCLAAAGARRARPAC